MNGRENGASRGLAPADRATLLVGERFDCAEAELIRLEAQLADALLAQGEESLVPIRPLLDAALQRNLGRASPALIAMTLSGLRQQHAAAAASELRRLRHAPPLDGAGGCQDGPDADPEGAALWREIYFLREARADLSRRILRLEAGLARLPAQALSQVAPRHR
jgi:hypothetical protein